MQHGAGEAFRIAWHSPTHVWEARLNLSQQEPKPPGHWGCRRQAAEMQIDSTGGNYREQGTTLALGLKTILA